MVVEKHGWLEMFDWVGTNGGQQNDCNAQTPMPPLTQLTTAKIITRNNTNEKFKGTKKTNIDKPTGWINKWGAHVPPKAIMFCCLFVYFVCLFVSKFALNEVPIVNVDADVKWGMLAEVPKEELHQFCAQASLVRPRPEEVHVDSLHVCVVVIVLFQFVLFVLCCVVMVFRRSFVCLFVRSFVRLLN